MIKHRSFFSLIFVFISIFAYSQKSELVVTEDFKSAHRTSDYPEGFYYTYEDFIKKSAKPSLKITKKNLQGAIIQEEDLGDNQIFFYSTTSQSKITDVFAICHKGNLYVQQKSLTKYAKKGNKNEYSNNPNSYHRVINEGKFLYLEGAFANAWAKGASYNLGASGGVYASTLNKLKGVVIDYESNKFDFIKNCKDFKLFLKEHNSNETIDCETYNILQVREIVNKLIVE